MSQFRSHFAGLCFCLFTFVSAHQGLAQNTQAQPSPSPTPEPAAAAAPGPSEQTVRDPLALRPASPSAAIVSPYRMSDLQISATLDLYGPFGLQNAPPDDQRFRVRSAEIMVFGALDPVFDAVLTLSGHDHEGAFELGLHEGYIASTKLIPQSRFKIGKFLLGIGRLNQFHLHDWPFPSAPKEHYEFFDPIERVEGAFDTGIEYSWLAPLDFYLDITVGVTNGYKYGHFEEEGNDRPPAPTHYIHPVTFFGSGSKGTQVGVTYLGRSNPSGERTRLVGTDVTFKKRTGAVLDWLIQSELYHQHQRPADRSLPVKEQIGWYVYGQHGFNERWSTGLRVDGFTTPTLRNAEGAKRDNFDWALVPVVSYKTSEFFTARAAYTYSVESVSGVDNRVEQRIEIQFIGMLGAHPAHDF